MADTIRIEIGTEVYELSGERGAFYFLVEVAKSIPGRRWDAERKIWVVPAEKREVALRHLNEGYARITFKTRDGYRSHTGRFPQFTVTQVK